MRIKDQIGSAFSDVSEDELKEFQKTGKLVVAGHELDSEDVKVMK